MRQASERHQRRREILLFSFRLFFLIYLEIARCKWGEERLKTTAQTTWCHARRRLKIKATAIGRLETWKVQSGAVVVETSQEAPVTFCSHFSFFTIRVTFDSSQIIIRLSVRLSKMNLKIHPNVTFRILEPSTGRSIASTHKKFWHEKSNKLIKNNFRIHQINFHRCEKNEMLFWLSQSSVKASQHLTWVWKWNICSRLRFGQQKAPKKVVFYTLQTHQISSSRWTRFTKIKFYLLQKAAEMEMIKIYEIVCCLFYVWWGLRSWGYDVCHVHISSSFECSLMWRAMWKFKISKEFLLWALITLFLTLFTFFSSKVKAAEVCFCK